MQQVTTQQQPKHKHLTWIFWVIFSAVVLITMLLGLVIFWLLKTQNLTTASNIISLIASIVAILIGPLTLFFTITHLPSAQTTATDQETNHSPRLPIPTEQSEIASPTTLWMVPYHRNPFFTGRETLLQQLHDHFSQAATATITQPPAITGLGGIGKTQIAIEYAHRHREEYQYVLWVNAVEPITLTEDFVQIARLLQLPIKEEQDQSIVVEAVKQWLANHDGWFLILDNADDLNLASVFLPPVGRGHILLTTRDAATGSIANFEVDKMDTRERVGNCSYGVPSY